LPPKLSSPTHVAKIVRQLWLNSSYVNHELRAASAEWEDARL